MFKRPSDGGLKQHINKKKECNEAQKREVMTATAVAGLLNREDEQVEDRYYYTRGSVISQRDKSEEAKVSESGEIPSNLDDSATTDWEPMVMDPDDSDSDDDAYDPDQEASDSHDDTTSYGAVVEEESFESDIDEGADAEEDVEEAPDKVPPNTEMLNGFHDYCSTHDYNFVQLSKEEITSIKLLDILKRKKAPLNAFEEVLEWHLK